jgi:hypothetical protein
MGRVPYTQWRPTWEPGLQFFKRGGALNNSGVNFVLDLAPRERWESRLRGEPILLLCRCHF